MTVFANRLEHEYLRLGLFLQVQNQPHDTGLVTADAHTAHVRIGR